MWGHGGFGNTYTFCSMLMWTWNSSRKWILLKNGEKSYKNYIIYTCVNGLNDFLKNLIALFFRYFLFSDKYMDIILMYIKYEAGIQC